MEKIFFNCLRKRKEKSMIDNGLEQALKELDVDKFIRMQKSLNLALKTIFTRLERFLLKNQQAFVLNSESNNQDSSESDRLSN